MTGAAPIDPSPVLACAARWRPSKGWASTVQPARDALLAGATGLAAAREWSEVAMMMGDTRGAPLALVVCLHAEAGLPAGVEDGRLAAHRNLCLIDLRLAAAVQPGPVKLVELGTPGVVAGHPGPLAAWLAQALAPWRGELDRAAWYALQLAAVRTGIVAAPEPTPEEDHRPASRI